MIMKGSSDKERLLKIIRNSLIEKGDIPYPDIDMSKNVYKNIEDDYLMVFAERFVAGGGKFQYCNSDEEAMERILTLMEYRNWTLENKDVLILKAIKTVCNINLIMLNANDILNDELPEILIVICYSSDITPNMELDRFDTPSNNPTLIINPIKLLQDELKEIYFYVVEDMN